MSESVDEIEAKPKKTTRSRGRKSMGASKDDDDASSIFSVQSDQPDEAETVARRTRNRGAKKSPATEQDDHETKPKHSKNDESGRFKNRFKFGFICVNL